MNDILNQLANYGAHFDQAIKRGTHSAPESVPPVITGINEGDMIVLDTSNGEAGTDQSSGSNGSSGSSWPVVALAAAALVLVIVGGLFLVSSSDDRETTDAATSPAESATQSAPTPALMSADAVLEGYVEAYNSGDIDAVMAFYTDESVIVGNPLRSRAEGLTGVRSLHVADMAVAALKDAYSVSNVEVVGGDTVTWDTRWTNRRGEDRCAAGHSAVVENGAIESWNWPVPSRCSRRSEVIEGFVEASNAGDVDAVMDYYTEESRVVGHPGRSLVEGLSGLRALEIQSLEWSAGAPDPWVISNVEVVGNTVTWDDRWTNNRRDEDLCGAGHSAVVEQGAIVSWTWPFRNPCSQVTDVLEGYVEAYNSGDIDAVMELFTDESVIKWHPRRTHAEGLSEIRSLYVDDMAAAASTDAYEISNVEVVGHTVTWDHRWTNNTGGEFCGTGHSAEVDRGTIVRWVWGPFEPCS